MSNPQQHPAAFFHPFEDWSDGDNQFFGLCVQKRAITTVLPDSGDWQEYHINYMGGGIYEIEYCPSEVTGTDQPQYRGKIPTREFFEALINSMEYPLPAGWAWKDPAPGHPEVPLDYETPARPRPRYVNLKDKLAAQDDAAPMEDRWDYDHGPDHMREVSESHVNDKSLLP